MSQVINNFNIKRNIGVFLFLAFFTALLAFLILFTRPIKDEKTRSSIQTILDASEKARYKLGPLISINVPYAKSSIFYELIDVKNRSQKKFVVLTRITGFNGPIATVFIGDNENIEFIGIAGITNPLSTPLDYGLTNTIIQHWKKIIQNTYVKGLNK